jgi:hypothetical protein
VVVWLFVLTQRKSYQYIAVIGTDVGVFYQVARQRVKSLLDVQKMRTMEMLDPDI